MKLTEKNTLVYVILAAVIVLLIPYLVRFLFYDNIMIGEESYYHANIARQIIEQKSLIQDPNYVFNPYHLVLASAGYFIGIDLASKIIPFLLGLLSVLMFYLILKEFKIEIMQRFVILLILVISPAFIYLSVISNTNSVPVFLSLLGIYLFFKKNIFLTVFSLLAFAAAIPFGMFNALLAITMILAYLIEEKQKEESPLKPKKPMFSFQSKKAAAFLFIFFIISVLCFPLYFHQKTNVLPAENILQNSISDFGALIGIGIFNIFLAIAGFFLMWKKKKEYLFIFLLLLIMIISSFYAKNVIIYLTFVFSVFAGYAFIKIRDMNWQVKTIKNLTILLIICGLAFSAISYLNRVSNMQPDNEIIKSLDWLKHYSRQDEVVFSHYSKGFWIADIAERPVVTDKMFEYYPYAEERFNDSLEIFYSRNLKDTKILLEKYNINYIWIDNEMKNGLVWEKEQQGLLFLFRNNETFNNIYNNQGIEIWEIIKEV
ncbi:hypothetical protein COY26_01605 [Candidatus Woesearchaeota archaeon CG_4_10_14_0_2_um_filter_33_10]|nr:MAG: hypothetical protein COY26_01605 [Candidatus Woesearchaeota archaeon CG_4_10_14_0_2_um_filter_33_10]